MEKISFFEKFQRKAGRLAGVGLAGVLVFAYVTLLGGIPDHIYIHDEKDAIELALPVSFEQSSGKTQKTAEPIGTYRGGERSGIQVDRGNVTYTCKLFGCIPLKEVHAQVVEEQTVLPGGIPVGIYVKTDGVLVIGTGKVTSQRGELESPAEHLVKSGDYIREVNGVEISGKEELIECVANCGGQRVILKLLREGELIEVAVEPVACEKGGYKLGLWVRDDLAGIGTLTYLTDQLGYGALGHGVSDADTGTMLSIKEGKLYQCNIAEVVRGRSGTPGELSGVIQYGKDYHMGSINENTITGIYGNMIKIPEMISSQEALPVGHKQNIKVGDATIISTVGDKTDTYSIRITKVNYRENIEYREIMFEVTDETLLEKTGGIVQGMSGSPIIQNGKIIGAVTHVFVNDSTKGYGIFIEDMLEHESIF